MPKKSMCPCQHEKYGYTLQGGVLDKDSQASKHHLRKPAGWAIQKAVIEHHRTEIKFIVINDTESGRRYRSSLDNFIKYALSLERTGFGAQWAMEDRRWTITGPGEHDKVAVQMGLF